MKNVKMTNKVALEFAISNLLAQADLDTTTYGELEQFNEVVQKLRKMLEQVEKKNSSVSKDGKKVLSPTQKENEKLKELILAELEKAEKPMQIKELMTKEGLEFSNQKLSALVRQLVTDGKVQRFEEKKVATFGIVGA